MTSVELNAQVAAEEAAEERRNAANLQRESEFFVSGEGIRINQEHVPLLPALTEVAVATSL